VTTTNTWERRRLVNYGDFIATVRDRGEYISVEEADRVTRTVLRQLGQRLGTHAPHLAAQLPRELKDAVASGDGNAPSHGIHAFLHELSGQLNATEETAKWDASAVLSTTADAVSGGELNQILSQLPAAYAPLFGKAELT
jgi:uncharacterized protein (DUF2267 family)